MCSRQTSAKYTSRDSPPFPANQCCGQTRLGNDGYMWFSTRAGVQSACTWKKNFTPKSPPRSPPPTKKSPKKSPARKLPTRSKKSPKRVMSMATCIAEILRDEEITSNEQWRSWKAYAKKYCKKEVEDLRNGR